MSDTPASRSILIAPTVDEWRAMSLDERDRLLVKILDALWEQRVERAKARAEQAEAQAEQAEALAEQAIAGLRAGILAAFEARGIAIADELRDRVLVCEEPQTLQRWLLRALSAKAVEEVFAGGSKE